MKKRIRKIAGAVFLALAIAFTQVPASFVEAISPEAEFKRDGNILISYTGTASVVSVPSGVKTISTDAFAGNRYLESVTVPSSVEVIENGAFRDCPNLDSVYFSEGLQTIESGAFSMCPELDTVKFSGTIIELGAGVFAGDDELKTIDLGKNSYFSVFDGALYSWDKTKLFQVFAGRKGDVFDMPDTVADIERYAFWGCDRLECVELSAHLTEIPEYSFSNCSRLEEVSLPYSIRKIGAKSFEDCVSLEYIVLPVSVTNIHPTAFDGCYNLKISAQEGTTAYEFARAFETTNLLLMEQEEAVSENTIGNIYKDSAPGQTLTDKAEVQEEEDDDGEVTEEVPDVYNPLNPADVSKLNVSDYYGQDSSDVLGKTRVVAGNAVVLYENTKQQPIETPQAAEEVFEPDFTAPDDGSHVIGKKSYYQSDSFRKLSMDGTIQAIDDFAFARTSAEHVVIPEGVTKIGYGAFYHCDELKCVEIPSTVNTIEPQAFDETPYINNWKNGGDADDFLVVGDGVLLAYKGDGARVFLPAHVKKIAGGVFRNHPEITEVTLNEGLMEIGEDAFSGCTALSSVKGGSRVEKVCDRAFAMCPIAELTIGTNVKQVGLGAYKLAASETVVFTNKESLPAISYEKTATRLENDEMRMLAFPDADVAVVADANVQLKNTILDERYLGFRGVVVYIPDIDGSQAKMVYCTMCPDKDTGLLQIPASVRVNGKSYSLTGAHPDVFDAYETYEYWGDGEIKGIILPPSLGRISDYDTQFGFSTALPTAAAESEADATAQESSSDGQQSQEESDAKEYVTTVVLSSGYPNTDKMKADVLDDDAYYLFYISENKEQEKDLANAVEAEYGGLVDGQLKMMDLTLVERRSNVPISNFGNSRVEIFVPVSEAMQGQNICAVTLGESGELQTIYGTKQVLDGQNYFVFRTNHFSVYGIYAGIGEVGDRIKAESNNLLQKDVSPETGETFNPKWLLAIASLLIAVALLIGLPGRRRI